MATQLMRHRARIVAYMPSLRAAVRHFRAFSSYDERTRPDDVYVTVGTKTVFSRPWPDSKLGPLNPKNKTCPLPGNIGIPLENNALKIKPEKATSTASATTTTLPSNTEESDLITGQSGQDRQVNVLQSFNMATHQVEVEERGYHSQPSALDCLECIAQRCPNILRKDFQELFPDRHFHNGELTVITLSQKTDHDMTGWSQEVEMEREDLLHHFVVGAQDICSALQELGFWADFIDPSSGRPYLGAFTNATLFETDERYRHFGFEIEDLGCCKVIKHHVWGTYAYVGSVFTDAPCDHPILLALIDNDTDDIS